MKILTLSIVLLMVALLLMARHCNIKDGRGGMNDEPPLTLSPARSAAGKQKYGRVIA